jgi:hypothetical protein
MSNHKCKCCGKEMTDKEYIRYLEGEVARLTQELVLKGSAQITTPWVWPSTPQVDGTKDYIPKITWQYFNGAPVTPTGDFYSYVKNQVDANGSCMLYCCGTVESMYKDSIKEGTERLHEEGYASRSSACDTEWIKADA